MLRIREYRRVESLEEAYELNQKKTNRIIGGGLWMKSESYDCHRFKWSCIRSDQ